MHGMIREISFSILWVILGTLWWFGALTACLPLTLIILLKPDFRGALFSFFYSRILEPAIRAGLVPARKLTFKILKDSVDSQKRKAPLEVLEIGIGQGCNLEFYPDNCNLTVLDKNKHFESYFRQNARSFPHISYQRTVIQPAEDMRDVADGSMDVVVSTYVHCSVNDSRAVLQEVKRVLRPGGKYVFLEHVGFPRNCLGFYVQKFIGPLWTLSLNGCTVDRDTENAIEGAGFSQVTCKEYMSTRFWFYPASHQIFGVATK